MDFLAALEEIARNTEVRAQPLEAENTEVETDGIEIMGSASVMAERPSRETR